MKSILYVGMDVHKDNYVLCSYNFEKDEYFARIEAKPEARNIVQYINQLKLKHNYDEVVCGYEAGSLGYSLYHDLKELGVDCIILAPTTMAQKRKNGIKNDKRDAKNIASCLAFGTYSPVYVPTEEDNAVKEYIRMRDDTKLAFKKVKQQITSFCLRHGKRFIEGSSYWTLKHLKWLNDLQLDNMILQETLSEYLISYYQTQIKLETFDKRIEELSKDERYAEKVKKLSCMIGVKTHTALATIVEIGDFKRFIKAENFASYLGLVPGENSSGGTKRITGITKAGNSHIRRLLVEAAQCYTRGQIGHISKELAKRQSGNDPNVIAYANKGNERLRRKAYKIMFKSKRNIAVTAVARELACFIWGLMTDNIA